MPQPLIRFVALRSASLVLLSVLLLSVTISACSESAGEEGASGGAPAESDSTVFEDVTQTNLPTDALTGLSMDAFPGDLDGDGDLDLVIANEFRPNILLLNDGSGVFTNASDRLPAAERDSEDVGVADFDGDGDLDIIVVSEDDQVNEYYLNDGSGQFSDVGDRWPVTGTSNAVVVADLTGDNAPDIIVGNNGQNAILINDGSGGFTDETERRLPARDDVTQDIELGDADGDDDLDLLVGNEGDNRLLLNDGTGTFSEAPESALPVRDATEETREADFGDADGDGDLDIFFANTRFFQQGADPQNRLLLNDGSGTFTDVTADRYPTDDVATVDGDFIDVDADGDLDIVTGNTNVGGGGIREAAYRVFENDGSGTYTDATDRFFASSVTGSGFDIEAADYNGDGAIDLFLASRGTMDRLLFTR